VESSRRAALEEVLGPLPSRAAAAASEDEADAGGATATDAASTAESAVLRVVISRTLDRLKALRKREGQLQADISGALMV
jgi:hypothetical protein